MPVGGATVYSVLDKENREVGRGEFTVSGVDCSIEIELHKPVDWRAQEAREHACRLSCVCRKPCDFVVSNAAGAIVRIQRARKKTETEWRATFKLAKGRYVVHALGSRLAGVEEADLGSSGAVLRLSLAQPVQELRFRVLRDGTPVKGAEAYLKGWDTSRGGVPSEVWAVADDQGRLVLKRIPEDVRSVRLTIIGKDGVGRAVSVDAATTEVDIGEQGRR